MDDYSGQIPDNFEPNFNPMGESPYDGVFKMEEPSVGSTSDITNKLIRTHPK